LVRFGAALVFPPAFPRLRPALASEGEYRPSLSISNRNALAAGFASTSFTSTLSPSRKLSPLRSPASAHEV